VSAVRDLNVEFVCLCSFVCMYVCVKRYEINHLFDHNVGYVSEIRDQEVSDVTDLNCGVVLFRYLYKNAGTTTCILLIFWATVSNPLYNVWSLRGACVSFNMTRVLAKNVQVMYVLWYW
jgi:hypothetical protein